MESIKDALRIRLILGKFRVLRVNKGTLGLKFVVDLGNSVTGTFDLPTAADVRPNDLLTFYTEVLANDPADKPSKQ